MSVKTRLKRITNTCCRKRIVKKEREKLKKDSISLFAPNCLGGVISHDLGLQFKSPTVNLLFDGLEYFDFLENLEENLSAELIPCPYPRLEPKCYMYPVMTLKAKKEIQVHFVHYNSYKHAEDCWNRRKARIDFNNIYVIVIAGGPWWSEGNKEEIIERFEKLPYKNKIFLVNDKKYCNYPDVHYIKGYEGKPHIGEITQYTGWFGKKYFDCFDFVDWFNKG